MQKVIKLFLPFLFGLSFGGLLFGTWIICALSCFPERWAIWEGWTRIITSVFFPLFYFLTEQTMRIFPDPFEGIVNVCLAVIPYGVIGCLIACIRNKFRNN